MIKEAAHIKIADDVKRKYFKTRVYSRIRYLNHLMLEIKKPATKKLAQRLTKTQKKMKRMTK